MSITPFHFKLKKVSSREQRLIKALYSYLPDTGLAEGFGQGIREAIARHVGEDFELKLEMLEHKHFSSFLSRLPKLSIMAIVGMAPLSNKVILEIDVPLATLLIERMLGGQVEAMQEPRALSDTEQGVLQYLLLQVMAHIHRLCAKDARAHFRFERLAFAHHEVRELADENDGVAVLTFRAEIGRYCGFVRLAMPDPFIEGAFLDVPSPDEVRVSERSWTEAQLERFGYVRMPLWAEVGRTTVTPADIRGLEEGDVVLLDAASAYPVKGKLEGKVILRAGRGMCGGIDADLDIKKGRVNCKIVGFHKGD